MMTKKKISAAAKRVAVAADAALVKAGDAAKRRQHGRAFKTALKATAKAAAIAAATAVTVLAARTAARARRQRAAAPTTTP
jgi:hypothetical protein